MSRPIPAPPHAAPSPSGIEWLAVDADDQDPDELIDAAQIADLLGLAHRNSVSTYRSRYEDFPRGQRAVGGGRRLLWPRGEILAWQRAFAARRQQDENGTHPKLDDLVAATVRLMMTTGSADVSIRQIAAEAGVAHSDLYRYATSKDHLLRLAIQRLNDEFADSMPTQYDTLADGMEALLTALRQRRPALIVLAQEIMADPDSPPPSRIALGSVADAVAAHRAESGSSSTVDPEVIAVCLGALAWGVALFAGRWRTPLGLEEVPIDQVATVARAILEA